MKRNLYFLFVIMICAGIFFLPSCGKEGPAGPQGATGAAGANGSNGAAGATGAQGAKGDTGTANVIYSGWIYLDSSNFIENKKTVSTTTVLWKDGTSHTLYDTTIEYKLSITAPKLTQSILNSGDIEIFSKMKGGGGNLSGGTGDTTVRRGLWWNTYPANAAALNSTYDNVQRQWVYDGTTSTSVIWPDLDNSGSFAYTAGAMSVYSTLDKQNGNIVSPISGYTPPKIRIAMRYILIPGGVTARRSGPPVDYNNYKAVCSYYHIPE